MEEKFTESVGAEIAFCRSTTNDAQRKIFQLIINAMMKLIISPYQLHLTEMLN